MQMARLSAIKVILNPVSYVRLNPGQDFLPDHMVVLLGVRELELKGGRNA